jgi:hypothetical protein
LDHSTVPSVSKHDCSRFAGDADLGEAVAVVVGDGRRAAEAAGLRRHPQDGAGVAVWRRTEGVRDDDDLGAPSRSKSATAG